MSTSSDISESIVVRRTFQNTPEALFSAWTNADELQQWFHPMEVIATKSVEVDLQVGGRYRIEMQNTETKEAFVCVGSYQEIERPNKLVFTWSWEQGQDVGETLVTIDFVQQADGTEVVITHERFPNLEAAQHHTEGWTGCLEMLSRHAT